MALPVHGKAIVLTPTPRPLPAHGRSPRARPHRPWRPLRVWQVTASYVTACLAMAEGQPGIKAPRPPQAGSFVDDPYLIDPTKEGLLPLFGPK